MKNGKVYCEQHYVERFGHRCASCHNPILSEGLKALDKFWHAQCFTCSTCGKQLAGAGAERTKFFAETDHNGEQALFCEEDYNKLFRPRCKGCGKPILDSRALNALGGIWHRECLVCDHCNKPLASAGSGGSKHSFFQHNGGIYCEKDYLELFASK